LQTLVQKHFSKHNHKGKLIEIPSHGQVHT